MGYRSTPPSPVPHQAEVVGKSYGKTLLYILSIANLALVLRRNTFLPRPVWIYTDNQGLRITNYYGFDSDRALVNMLMHCAKLPSSTSKIWLTYLLI